MNVRLATCRHSLMIVMIGASVAGRGSEPSPTAAEPPRAALSDANSHDFGTVTEGTLAVHEFECVNRHPESVSVRQPDDVKAGCGCSVVTVTPSTVAPGDRARVRVTVNTSGRSGRFGHSATVTWRTADGAPLPETLTVSGEVVSLFRCTPADLAFGPDDIRDGREKEVRVTGARSHPIVWPDVSLAPNEAGWFEIRRVGEDDAGVRFSVRCTPPVDVESTRVMARVSGRVASTAPDRAGQTVTLELPVSIRQVVELVAQPSAVRLTASTAQRYGGRFLLRGATVAAGGEFIAAVTASGRPVEWTLRQEPGSRTAIVEVELTRASADRPTALRVLARNGREVQIPIVWPDA